METKGFDILVVTIVRKKAKPYRPMPKKKEKVQPDEEDEESKQKLAELNLKYRDRAKERRAKERTADEEDTLPMEEE